jgi:predicted GIY-YIG superfamily endonuclease
VHLIYFGRSYAHIAHYLGWTEDLADRLNWHQAGNGVRFMAVIAEAGIGWTLARRTSA